MMDRPYINDVIRELKLLGYEEGKAKEILIRYYRHLKRTCGFRLNSYDFAKEIDSIHKAVNKKFDPSEPNQIYIGHLKNRVKSNRKD